MMYLKTNLPGWERAIRVALGVVIAVMAWRTAAAPWMIWAGAAMGTMLAVTGFVGFCPMCAMVGRRAIARE
ncbi:MAG: DUF2892 domain-containing protein [Xanthobacteraceae bacterium]|nr:DUF2892 domain-containing protein [Xanthobacteraceae bacterium]